MFNSIRQHRLFLPIITYVSVIVAMIFWGFSYVWTNIAMRTFPVLTLLELRLTIATILLFVFGYSFHFMQKPKREDIKWFLLMALFEPFLYFIGETYGLTRVSPTMASVIISTIPLFAPIVAYFLLKERVTWTNIAGILLSVGGVIAIVSAHQYEARGTDGIGLMLLSLAVISAIFYSVVLKKLTAHYNGITLVGYQNLIGIFFFLPLFLKFDAPKLSNLVLRADSIISVLMLALFASFIAFVLFAEAVRRIGVARSNVFCNLMPAVTALFSALILHEILSFQQIIGIAIVIGGLFVSQLQVHKHHQAVVCKPNTCETATIQNRTTESTNIK
jgi:drug/metabolite transporter (DMT)-like permease